LAELAGAAGGGSFTCFSAAAALLARFCSDSSAEDERYASVMLVAKKMVAVAQVVRVYELAIAGAGNWSMT